LIEYPVRIKFFSDTSSVSGPSGGNGSSKAPKASIEDEKQGKEQKKQTGLLSGMLGKLFGIGMIIEALSLPIKAVLDFVMIIAMALIKGVLSLMITLNKIGSVFWEAIKWLSGFFTNPFGDHSTQGIQDAFSELKNLFTSSGKGSGEEIIPVSQLVELGNNVLITSDELDSMAPLLKEFGYSVDQLSLPLDRNSELLRVMSEVTGISTGQLEKMGMTVKDVVEKLLSINWSKKSSSGNYSGSAATNSPTSLVRGIDDATWQNEWNRMADELFPPKAFGGIIPEDGLYQMHAGENVSRGNTVGSSGGQTNNITVNVNGNADNSTIDKISQAISLEMRGYSRW